MQIMEALKIVAEIQGYTNKTIAERMTVKQNQYPQPGDHDYTEKEISRILNSEKIPLVKTFNLLKCALGLKHDPIRYL